MKMNELRPEEYIGEEVIVTSAYGDKWRGRAVAYNDKPSVLIEYEDGSRMMLPAKNMRLANPPKPWHGAKPGEVWVITTRNVSNEVAVQRTPGGRWQYNDGVLFEDDHSVIETGRRIWPEDSNDS